MGLFLLTPMNTSPELLANQISVIFKPGADALPLQNSTSWLVYFKGTSIELSNAIGVTGHGPSSVVGSVLITAVSSYYGRGPSDMWDWVKMWFEQE